MNSILQALKELPEKLCEIELIDKDLNRFLEEYQPTFDKFLLNYVKDRIEDLDNAIVPPKEKRRDFRVAKAGVPRSLETKHRLSEYLPRY